MTAQELIADLPAIDGDDILAEMFLTDEDPADIQEREEREREAARNTYGPRQLDGELLASYRAQVEQDRYLAIMARKAEAMVKAAPSKWHTKCSKCSGMGTISSYMHIARGKCYKCNGAGWIA